MFALDVDGDRDVDVLSASNIDDTVAWYENDGSQGFSTRVVTVAADGASSVSAVDLDGDSDVDALSVTNSAATAVWFENDGAQSFTHHVRSCVTSTTARDSLKMRSRPRRDRFGSFLDEANSRGLPSTRVEEALSK